MPQETLYVLGLPTETIIIYRQVASGAWHFKPHIVWQRARQRERASHVAGRLVRSVLAVGLIRPQPLLQLRSSRINTLYLYFRFRSLCL